MSQSCSDYLNTQLPLSSRLFCASGVAAIDAAAQAAGLSSQQLMSRAAHAALEEIERIWSRTAVIDRLRRRQ